MNCGVDEVLVVNASPLIFLAKVRHLALLERLGGRVTVPRAVSEEVGRFGPHDSAVRALEASPWIQVVRDVAPPASVIAWISEPENQP